MKVWPFLHDISKSMPTVQLRKKLTAHKDNIVADFQHKTSISLRHLKDMQYSGKVEDGVKFQIHTRAKSI